MDGQHTHTEPLRFSDPRQQRIHDLLLLIGPGPAAFYRDACRIMQASVSSPFETTTHLVGHLLREIESALRAVVSSAAEHTEPPSRRTRQGTHRREIIAILKGLGIEETEPVAQAWLRIAMPENEEALHRRAHRDALSAPRPADAPFHAFWNEMEGILFVVLTQFEARFLKGFALLDTLIDHPSPGKAEVDRLRN